MNANDAVALHRQVLQQVFDEEYFPHLAHRLMEAQRYSNIAETEDTGAICSFWNAFWFALPDQQYIRTPIFFRICDLAEGAYVDH